jgi:nitrate/nitrite transport system permease protein
VTARAWLLISLLLGAIFVGAWQAAVVRQPKGKGLPGPAAVAVEAWQMVRHPFYDNGPNDKGIGLQLGASLGRLVVGYVAGSAVAIMLGVTLGLSPVLYRAVNPYIQVLKPVSPLAWMPLFLYTLKDSGQSAILVIFMSSLWPTLANTAFGVASIKRDYLNVAAILQLGWLRRLVTVVLPGGGAGDRRGPAHLDRQRVDRDRRRRDADRRHRHRLLRVERVEQPAAHERDLRDPRDRTDRRAPRRRTRAPVARARV